VTRRGPRARVAIARHGSGNGTQIRNGGSGRERMGSVAVWNTAMDVDRYRVRTWNELAAA
jgi:hypothetical protein